MNVALYRGEKVLAIFLCTAGHIAALDERQKYFHRLFHGACRLYHLRQEHLARAEQVAYKLHAAHQRTFDYRLWGREMVKSLVEVIFKELTVTFLKGVDKAVVEGDSEAVDWLHILGSLLVLVFLSDVNETLRGIRLAAEDYILKGDEQVIGNIVVHHLRRGVHDSHVKSGFYGMEQEHGVHGLTEIVVATEREREVAYAAAHLCAGEIVVNPFRGTDEVEGITVMFLHARGDGQDVRVKNDVLRRERQFLGKQTVGTGAYFYFAVEGGGLPLFVESHYYYRRAELLYSPCVF